MKDQIQDLIDYTIINSIVEDMEIKQGSTKYKKAVKYLIEQLKKEI